MSLFLSRSLVLNNPTRRRCRVGNTIRFLRHRFVPPDAVRLLFFRPADDGHNDQDNPQDHNGANADQTNPSTIVAGAFAKGSGSMKYSRRYQVNDTGKAAAERQNREHDDGNDHHRRAFLCGCGSGFGSGRGSNWRGFHCFFSSGSNGIIHRNKSGKESGWVSRPNYTLKPANTRIFRPISGG